MSRLHTMRQLCNLANTKMVTIGSYGKLTNIRKNVQIIQIISLCDVLQVNNGITKTIIHLLSCTCFSASFTKKRLK